MKLNPKTPIKVSAKVKELVKSLGLTGTPRFLNYIHASDSYRATYCFNNCEDEVAISGGEVVYGWQIWEDRKNGFIEAEFHSVIKVNGVLKDISPRQSKDKQILFVPDRNRSSGRKGENSWISWSNHKMINDEVAEPTFELEIKELDNDYSEVITV